MTIIITVDEHRNEHGRIPCTVSGPGWLAAGSVNTPGEVGKWAEEIASARRAASPLPASTGAWGFALPATGRAP